MTLAFLTIPLICLFAFAVLLFAVSWKQSPLARLERVDRRTLVFGAVSSVLIILGMYGKPNPHRLSNDMSWYWVHLPLLALAFIVAIVTVVAQQRRRVPPAVSRSDSSVNRRLGR